MLFVTYMFYASTLFYCLHMGKMAALVGYAGYKYPMRQFMLDTVLFTISVTGLGLCITLLKFY